MGRITEVMGSLPRDIVDKACQRFCSRVMPVVEACGDFSK